MREINALVVHCSASPDAMDIGFKEINQWHLQKGWKAPSGVSCGYHYILRRNGTVEVGRMLNEVGAHVEGANANTIGVCLVGTHEFTESQIKSLDRVLEGLKGVFPKAEIKEHREYESAKKQHKTCPNLKVKDVLGI